MIILTTGIIINKLSARGKSALPKMFPSERRIADSLCTRRMIGRMMIYGNPKDAHDRSFPTFGEFQESAHHFLLQTNSPLPIGTVTQSNLSSFSAFFIIPLINS